MIHKTMKMTLLAIGTLAGAGMLLGQSLGEIARQERARRQSEKPAATKVWTNDNIPRASRIEPAPTSAESEPPVAEGAPPAAEGTPPATSETTGEDQKHSKDFWQARFKSVRAQLAGAEERQHLAEDELNMLQIQEVRELDPTAKNDLGSKITAKSAEVDQVRAVTAQAKKALDDLQKEFDASGAPSDWSKTD